jgi:hypothetical protein
MATAELTGTTRGREPRQRSVVLCAYLTLWAITLAGAALAALLGRAPVRIAMGLSLSASANPPPSLAHVLALAAHNLPICVWPLLLGSLRLSAGSLWRRVADIGVGACVLANMLPVAAALGGYGWELLPYVPQLPVEWAALAVGYGSWMLERRHGLVGSERLKLLGVVSVLLLMAAALETCAVPHR